GNRLPDPRGPPRGRAHPGPARAAAGDHPAVRRPHGGRRRRGQRRHPPARAARPRPVARAAGDEAGAELRRDAAAGEPEPQPGRAHPRLRGLLRGRSRPCRGGGPCPSGCL
ncbi:MAG: hypothetical protein AVDCRST_MAG30-2213, partial [uncultured Solirubrobacteraceae bacterium]